MYRELTADALRSRLGLQPDDAPAGVIVFGGLQPQRVLQWWAERLEGARSVGSYPALLGRYEGHMVLFGVTYGAALTSEIVHFAGLLATPLAIQLGSFGGLQRGMAVGDVFFPTLAARGDGASDCYLTPDEPADASPDLLHAMRHDADARGLRTHSGPHVTTAALFAETRDDIARWNAQGYRGVDLETATTFAVARHFGMRRAAALVLIDNLIEDHSLLDVTAAQRSAHHAVAERTAELALDTIVAWATHNQPKP
ncbi:MAG: hypothetical protein H7Y32_01850 [Chloroflexales bacterium]|nr:hypothetical protein [Chloroflexales bacterium]